MASPDFRERLLEGLGGNWPEPCPLEVEVVERGDGDGYRFEKILYQTEPGDRAPAYLLIPSRVGCASPAPAICVWHQHNDQWQLGKSEPAGLAGDPVQHSGKALAREGYVVLCPDALGFEEREEAYALKGRDLERFLFLRYVVSGKCLAWKNILDMRRAVDLLVSRPEVRADRIGCYGHSMGATHTWMVGPWEPRLRALVGNCCLPTYCGIDAHQLLHCFPNFVPGIHRYGDTPDIAALIAPRPFHMNFGEMDQGSPIEEVREGVEIIQHAYKRHAAANRFSWFIEANSGHVLSVPMWERVLAFFDRYLRDSSH